MNPRKAAQIFILGVVIGLTVLGGNQALKWKSGVDQFIVASDQTHRAIVGAWNAKFAPQPAEATEE